MLDQKLQKCFSNHKERALGYIASKPSVDAETCPEWFHDGQMEMWSVTKRVIFCLCGKQSGKALDIDTEIPTPNGFTRMGDLRLGNEVFCPDGNIAIITSVSPIMYDHDCYSVLFDDGSSVIADGEHLWSTQTVPERKEGGRHKPRHSIKTTVQIRDTLLYGKQKIRNHSVDMPSPAEYPERELPIDPYTLGAWLGDGSSYHNSITCADPEIIQEIASSGLIVGKARECGSGKAKGYTIGMSAHGAGGNHRGQDSLVVTLRKMGLLQNKHIPQEYLLGSVNQRLSLLQGLMDTDGYCGGTCEFSNKNPRIIEQVVELCRSLGIKCKVKWRNVNGFSSARVTFTTTLPVFRLPRKLNRLPRVARSDHRRRYIVSVEKVESRPVKCIGISHPSRLYLAGRDYIPTHNTISGPRWLRREIQRTACLIESDDQPPNDYLVAGPTLSLLEKKAVPEFLRVFPDEYGSYNKAKNIFTFSSEGAKKLLGYVTPITVYFGYASNPDSLAAMTIKGCWLDEAGQEQFKRDSYEEIEARCLANGARILITTTAYIVSGWLRDMYESAIDGSSDVGLVQYKTRDLARAHMRRGDLPACKRVLSMLRRAKERLPEWKYLMAYEGRFTRPPGVVYDCFSGEVGAIKEHSVERFAIPDDWPLFWGMDFGPVHTCCLMFAERPTDKKLFLYASYLPAEQGDGRRTFGEHATAMKLKSMSCMESKTFREPVGVYGGARNEDAQRIQYHRLGIRVNKPRYINDPATQIECTYGAIKNNKIAVFNDLSGFFGEINTYSYAIDEEQNVNDAKIVDSATYHRMDALRSVIGTICPGKQIETEVFHRFQEPTSRKPYMAFKM